MRIELSGTSQVTSPPPGELARGGQEGVNRKPARVVGRATHRQVQSLCDLGALCGKIFYFGKTMSKVDLLWILRYNLTYHEGRHSIQRRCSILPPGAEIVKEACDEDRYT